MTSDHEWSRRMGAASAKAAATERNDVPALSQVWHRVDEPTDDDSDRPSH